MNSQTKKEVGDVQVQEGYYLSKEYGSLERFISYYYQLDAIRSVKPESVLIIGVGDDVIPGLLRQAIPKVTTVDIDETLEPDVVADVRKMPFDDSSYDVVCAFQVLEHLPFEDQEGILDEFHRISKNDVIIAVPHRRTGLDVVIKLPFIRTLLKRNYLRILCLFPIKFQGFEASGQHYWEIDWFTTKLSSVRKLMRQKFKIIREATPVLDPYRRFFYLKKK